MKVRVGFGLGVTAAVGIGGPSLLSIIDACESLGLDSIWFSERVTFDIADPMAAMAAVAARTKRLKFGTSVLVLPGRNPVLLAKELATIDVLSAGRLVVGVGLGAPSPSEHDAFMVDRAEAGERAVEALSLIKRLWTEERVTHKGRFFAVKDLGILPKPVQKPHPDVWFGGHSRAALKRVGALGDGWLPSFITVAEYKAKADVIRRVAGEAGREVDEEHYGALVAYVPNAGGFDPAPVLSAVAARRPGVAPQDVVVTDGRLRERLEDFIEQGASKFVVVPVVPPPDWEAELARIRRDIAGTLEN